MPDIRMLGDNQYTDLLNGCPGEIVATAPTVADDGFTLDNLPRNELLTFAANGTPGGGWIYLHWVADGVDPVTEPASEENSITVVFGERVNFKVTNSYPTLNLTVRNSGGGFVVYRMS